MSSKVWEVQFARFNKVPKTSNDEGGLRSESAICINVHRDGTLYRLNWQQDSQRHFVEEYDATTSEFKLSDSQAITEQRFPLRLFSQGQIAALAGGSQQALLRVIDDAAGTQVKQDAFQDAKRAFMVTRARMRELQGKLLGREKINLSLQDVQRKLTRFESTDHAAILKKYQQISLQKQEIERQFEATDALADHLKNLSTDLLPESLPDGLFDTNNDRVVLEIIQQLKLAVEKASKEVERAANDLKVKGKSLKLNLETDPWFSHISDATAAYEKLKADLQEQGVNDPSEYGRHVQEKLKLEIELSKLDEQQKQFDVLKEKALSELAQVSIARREISNQRSAFLNATLSDNPYVRIELIAYSRDVHSIERSLREILGASEGKYADDLYVEMQNNAQAKGVLADLMVAADISDKLGQLDSLSFEASLKALKKRLVDSCKGKGDFGGWFNKFLQSKTEQHPEYIDHILCWFPEDGLQVEYSRKGDGKHFQSIGQASAGQRAAAMLAFLLAHGNEPLVLDQPEDDLDNHLIYGLVVQQIRSNKLRRQLIIVTHNPNIVVNGDAELIHVLDFNNQCYLKQSGSLQDPSMRKEVCLVMEGGEEAFERRYKRLGKEN